MAALSPGPRLELEALEQALALLALGDVLRACGAVSRLWASAARSDFVWGELCQRLWADKVYVPAHLLDSAPKRLRRLDAYRESLRDASRTALTAEELCQFEWASRMKGWAGSDWTKDDPWWTGTGPASARRYHEDGTTSGKSTGSWRFVPACCGRTGPLGSFVRHSRGSRSFPTHVVSRYAKNWGWILQNCWGFSTSFPLPPRGQDPDLEDSGELCQSVTVESCSEEATRFNMGLPLPYDDGAEEEGEGTMLQATVQVNGTALRLPVSLVLQLLARARRAEEEEEQGEVDEDDSEDDDEEEEEEDNGAEEVGIVDQVVPQQNDTMQESEVDLGQ